MISVIVPFFNAEKTLHRCIDSILHQTYKDLEILLVNDGSTDNSGRIAEEYKADTRIQVFYKENGGLSSARNFGLDKADGDYISFVDADDWIEKSTFEIILDSIGDADICVFGRSTDSPKGSKIWAPTIKEETINGEEAVKRLIVHGSIKHAVWDKVYKAEVFEGIRFPEGHNYEDFYVTHIILRASQKIVLIPDILYHYVQNKGSITHTPSTNNNFDLWMACHDLYEAYKGHGKEYEQACLNSCINAIYRTWGSLFLMRKEESQQEQAKKIASFAKRHCMEVDGLKPQIRLVIYLATTATRWSMLLAYCMNQISGLLHPNRLY